jgi:hypothetical protein
MAIKNMTGFASWDRANPDHINQIQQLPSLVETELRRLSGVTGLDVRAIGNFNTSKRGEALAASKIQVQVPDGGSADEDKQIGAATGITATSAEFLNLLLSQLSALVDLSWSLERAIVVGPPGLSPVSGTSPALVFTEITSPFPSQRMFNITLDAELPDAGTADAVVTITPSHMAGFMYMTSFWVSAPGVITRIFQPPHAKLSGRWKLASAFTVTDNAGAHPIVDDIEAYPEADTRTFDGGAFASDFENDQGAKDAVYYIASQHQVNLRSRNCSVVPVIYGIDNALTQVEFSYFGNGFQGLTGPMPDGAMSDDVITITLTNTTGSPIASGTHVGDFASNNDVISIAATS